MKQQRPKNLNLFTIRFPIPAIASILHRLSGFILFIMTPFLLWVLHSSLSSQQSFENLQQAIANPFTKFVIWGTLSAFIYHFIAGIRHLFMDVGIGEELKSGRFTAMLTIILAVILSILTGLWLW